MPRRTGMMLDSSLRKILILFLLISGPAFVLVLFSPGLIYEICFHLFSAFDFKQAHNNYRRNVRPRAANMKKLVSNL